MLLVGLTGGIATGKSLVTRVLRDLGAHIIDADRIVHELLGPGEDACAEVIEHFGDAVRLPDGSVDRRALGDVVFSRPEERAWLNQCIHPRVYKAYAHQVKHIGERNPAAVVVLDAALLVETGYHKKMDLLIVVSADEEQQVRRLMERDHFTREQALARLRSQVPIAEKRALADFVIDNSGPREATEKQVRDLYPLLLEEAQEHE